MSHSQMLQQIGVTDFVLKIWYLKVHALFEKSVLVIRNDCSACWCKNIINESLETSLHCKFKVYFDGSIKKFIPLLKSLR